MASGRILKKNISLSRRLAALKDDSARLLYTWLIPFLDVSGRFYADVCIIKGQIVPRLHNFTLAKIEECLQDMVDNNLIKVYEYDGERYLQFVKFNEFQKIDKNRESPSKIPNPEGQYDEDYLMSLEKREVGRENWEHEEKIKTTTKTPPLLTTKEIRTLDNTLSPEAIDRLLMEFFPNNIHAPEAIGFLRQKFLDIADANEKVGNWERFFRGYLNWLKKKQPVKITTAATDSASPRCSNENIPNKEEIKEFIQQIKKNLMEEL